MKTVDVEMFCVVDACGDVGIGSTPEEAREKYESDIGDLSDAEGFRMVNVVVAVPVPEVKVLTGTVSALEDAVLTEVA